MARRPWLVPRGKDRQSLPRPIRRRGRVRLFGSAGSRNDLPSPMVARFGSPGLLAKDFVGVDQSICSVGIDDHALVIETIRYLREERCERDLVEPPT